MDGRVNGMPNVNQTPEQAARVDPLHRWARSPGSAPAKCSAFPGRIRSRTGAPSRPRSASGFRDFRSWTRPACGRAKSTPSRSWRRRSRMTARAPSSRWPRVRARPIPPSHPFTGSSSTLTPKRVLFLVKGQAVSRRYRNRRIGEFLKELDLAEGRSTGVPKILRAMRENGSPAPVFESDEDRTWFLVRLPVHERVRLEPTEQDTPQDTEHETEQVTAHETGQVEQLVVALTGEMSRAELQAALSLTHRD